MAKLTKELKTKIKELNNNFKKVDIKAGLGGALDSSGIIFSSLEPNYKNELMNLFRDRNFKTAYKNNNYTKIIKQCKQKIFEICNA